MKGSKRNQHRSSKRRLYYVDNPNKTELSMLKSSPKIQEGNEPAAVEAVDSADRTLQVSGVDILEVPGPVLEIKLEQEAIPEAAAPVAVELELELVQEPEDNDSVMEPAVLIPVEKERLQPVYTDDLSDAAVTGAKIAPRTIDGSKLKFGIIGTPWLQDYAVQSINIADKAVTSSKIAQESIAGEHLAEGSISGGKLLDHSIGGEKLKNGSIGPEKLADRIIGGEQIADGAIGSRHQRMHHHGGAARRRRGDRREDS